MSFELSPSHPSILAGEGGNSKLKTENSKLDYDLCPVQMITGNRLYG